MKFILANLYVRSFIVFLITISIIGGCKNSPPEQTSNPGGEVVVAGAGEFPESLAGVWKADKFRWAFKFEKDGRISKFRHTIGMYINVAEGGLMEEGEDDNYALYVVGPYVVKYDPEKRQLDVKITLDYFKMVLPMGTLEGKVDDYFSGIISDDNKTWQVDWRSYGWIEGADPPDPNVIDANPEKLVFTKIDLDKLQSEAEKSKSD